MTKTLSRVAMIFAFAYLIALVLIVFWPTPVDQPASELLTKVIAWMHAHGVPGFLGYSQIEFSANIVLFVPMGFIVSVWTRKAWLGLLVGAFASCLIELSQALFLQARFASGLDILANSLGAGIGALVYVAAHVLHGRRVRNKAQIRA